MPVTITRTAWIDDDGSGTTGTVINNAEKTLLYNQIDQGFALLDVEAGGDLNITGTVTATGNFITGAAGAIYEAGRGTPLGFAIDHPYFASDYSALAPMTWTVPSTNVLTNTYTLIGRLVIWTLVIDGGTLGGTVSNALNVRLPGNLASSRIARGGIGAMWNNGVATPAQFNCGAGGTSMAINRADSSNFALGTIYLYFNMQFWI
jgi:hypothetical protein